MRKRWNTVKKQHLCLQCLSPSHGMKDCDQRRNIDQSCYHSLLERDHDEVKPTEKNLITKAKNDTGDRTHTHMVDEEDAVDLTNLNRSGFASLRTVPVVVSFGDRSVETVALLDDGSTTIYVSENIAHQLKLPVKTETTRSSTIFGNNVETFESMLVEKMTIRGTGEEDSYEIPKI